MNNSINETWILGIRISDRIHDVSPLQSILTKFGCSIRTRLGLHQVVDESVAAGGIVLLELVGDKEEFLKLENELLQIEGLDVKKMVF
jgi:hypothetical protein